MKVARENLIERKPAGTAAKTDKRPSGRTAGAFAMSVLHFISSVRFGVVMLLLLFLCSLTGMFVMQQNMSGFREYYGALTPAQQTVYGALGIFDIYNSWYFTVLLALTGLSIILSSAFRIPKAWRFLRRPKLVVSPGFLKTRKFQAQRSAGEDPEKEAEKIAASWRTLGFKPKVTKKDGDIILFAQRNVWNRFGSHATHLALILIFIGGFLTSRYSEGGMVQIVPGRSSGEMVSFESQLEGDRMKRKQLPFVIECTDLQQKLIDPEGGLDPMNTIDWLSYITIKDGAKVSSGLVHLNEPFDYQGYRFFQSSFEPQGYARQITLSLEPLDGSPAREVTIARNQTVSVSNVGEISYSEFYPDFTVRQQRPGSLSGEYNNPAARLQITTPDGKTRPTLALNPALAAQFYKNVGKEELDHMLVAGSKAILKDFEKVAISHTLTVQYDPGREPVYAGFILLLISLSGVFFFSHQRVWALVQPGNEGSKINFGGDTNRYKAVFQERFESLVEAADEEKGDK